MPWHARLDLDYRTDSDGRTVVHHRHDGPLRVLKSLYPEGQSVCHNVIVHPPGGIVGGDTLSIHGVVRKGAHGFVSTPGATRFYGGDGLPGTQEVTLDLEPDSRLEWLPLETIAYEGCEAHNTLRVRLGAGAGLLAWDVAALGLPATGGGFSRGRIHQRMEIEGLWLEQGTIDAADHRLLNSPVGLAGHRSIGTMVLASGSPMSRDMIERLLEAARSVEPQIDASVHAACTSPNPQMVVVRALAPVVEPLIQHFQRTWTALRPLAWQQAATPVRIWAV